MRPGHSHRKTRRCNICQGPCKCMTTAFLWAYATAVVAILAWIKRDVIDWEDLGQLGVGGIAFNKAILDLHMADRLHIVGHKATAASLVTAACALTLGGGLITSGVFNLWDAPDWWWMPVLSTYMVASGFAKYRMHVGLLLPVSSVAVKLHELNDEDEGG